MGENEGGCETRHNIIEAGKEKHIFKHASQINDSGSYCRFYTPRECDTLAYDSNTFNVITCTWRLVLESFTMSFAEEDEFNRVFLPRRRSTD